MKVGLYGGTFDPIHHGHLILAREALETLELDRLVFIPNTISPHKIIHIAAPAPLRQAMVAAAIDSEPRFEVDDHEIRREGVSYTIDTLLYFKERLPDAEFFYLIGKDNLRELHTWRRIDEITMLARLVVLSRSESDAVHPYLTLQRQVDISATEIRARVAKGASIRYLVPESVRAIIEQNQLYREQTD
ncbi:MAG: nicotinate-nucleotide adenylyltransferase [Verrucomicrobiota bacterium]|nr:nicotinate-nucleotide adenylyltransferase [Verrucomicrobiota bacterium]